MKRAVPWMVAAGLIALAVAFGVRGRREPKTSPNAETPSAPAAAAPTADGVAYAFQDDAQLRDFTDQWQQRQTIALRMAVLKDYWEAEQVSAADLSATLQTQYGFDQAKNYSLDTEQRVLTEQKMPEPPAETALPAGEPAAAEERVPAHAFANEEEMQAFGVLWQQRKAVTVRMTVLQSLWEEQRVELATISDRLTAVYHLDPSKNYSLDATRRVLVEVETAPALAAPASAEAPPEPPATPAPAPNP